MPGRIGAEIFGTASASKHDAIREQGVEHAIDYRSMDFEQEVRRITGGQGLDVIMDALGPTSFRKDYRLLRPGGRLIMYGLSEVQSGSGKRDIPATLRSLARMPLATMPWWKSLAVMNENKGVFGLNMLAWWDQEGDLDRALEPLLEGLEKGDLKPVVAEAFPFDRAPDAHRMIEERRNVGKVVLVPCRRARRSPASAACMTGPSSTPVGSPSSSTSSPSWSRSGFIRTSAHLIRAQVSWWPGNVEVGGTHIHHLVWGICPYSCCGYMGVADRAPPSPWREIVAVLFGIGTGLTLDEFALWLNLKDVYW